jgi:hypothetical protein
VKKTKGESHLVESDEEQDWSKGMTSSEHMFVLSAAQSEQHTDKTKMTLKTFEEDLGQSGKSLRNKSMASEIMKRHMTTTKGD